MMMRLNQEIARTLGLPNVRELLAISMQADSTSSYGALEYRGAWRWRITPRWVRGSALTAAFRWHRIPALCWPHAMSVT